MPLPVHVESPTSHIYTLGSFFDVWGQPLDAGRVSTAIGHVAAFFNGRHYLGDPRSIPLVLHAQIQLDVGRPLIAPEAIRFPPGP